MRLVMEMEGRAESDGSSATGWDDELKVDEERRGRRVVGGGAGAP